MADEHVRDINLAVRRLLQSSRAMQSAAARQLGLRTTDVQAMDLVTAAADGRISPAELAERLGIRTASASALIDRLEAAGHLERARSEPVPGNGQRGRRRTTVTATRHARDEIRNTLRDVNEGFDEIARDLTPEQAETVLLFLDRCTQTLRDYAADTGDSERRTTRPRAAER